MQHCLKSHVVAHISFDDFVNQNMLSVLKESAHYTRTNSLGAKTYIFVEKYFQSICSSFVRMCLKPVGKYCVKVK